MKKKALQFTIIFIVLFLGVSLIFGKHGSPMAYIAGTLISGFIYYLLTLSFLTRIEKALQKTLSEDKRLQEDELLTYAFANHVQKFWICAIGGVCYLFRDKLLFMPHRMNLSQKEYIVLLEDIAKISPYKLCGIFTIGLKIELNSGKTDKFVIGKDCQLFQKLLPMFHTK